jgi:hypothetical protein
MRRVCIFLSLSFAISAFSQQGAAPQQTKLPPDASQTQSTKPSAETSPDWRTVWRNSIISFGVTDHNRILNQDFYKAIGTGIVIKVEGKNLYAITAKHIFCDPEHRWHPSRLNFRFAWEEHKSIYKFLGNPVSLQNSAGADLWVSLDDGSDVAALDVGSVPVPADEAQQRYAVISTETLATSDQIYEGAPVYVFGYPGLYGNESLVRAIVRQGIIAWINPSHPGDNVFLVDANLYPGNSGGPVIKVPFGLTKEGTFNYLGAGDLSLIGIVSQGIQQDISSTVSGPRIGSIEVHTPINGVGALGIVEPVTKVSKLLALIKDGTARPSVCKIDSTTASSKSRGTAPAKIPTASTAPK